MRCPREGAELEATEFLGVTMDACPYCDGTWLDAGELEALHHLSADLVGDGLETSDARGAISCPHCQQPLHTRWFSPTRKIVIDCCRQCGGVWLDSAELKAILAEAYQQRQAGP